jgi:hypothetical protein
LASPRQPIAARPAAGLDADRRREGLPRVGPFRLEQGPRVFDAARRAMQAALARPAHDVVTIAV